VRNPVVANRIRVQEAAYRMPTRLTAASPPAGSPAHLPSLALNQRCSHKTKHHRAPLSASHHASFSQSPFVRFDHSADQSILLQDQNEAERSLEPGKPTSIPAHTTTPALWSGKLSL